MNVSERNLLSLCVVVPRFALSTIALDILSLALFPALL